ncbi:MAG: hypothetical protein II059_02280 [Clostridia bacterium]|nr:hypothetical protein [Clostridia bacterium]
MKKTFNTKENKSTLTTTNANKKGAITMKKTGIRTKIIAAVLAAVTICSVGTMAFSASAMTVNAASIDTTTISQELEEYGDAAKNLLNRITDKDLEKMKQVGISTLLAGIAEFVPGGKTLNPALQALTGAAFGNKQMSLEDIDKRIDELYSRIDQFEKDMQNELKNILSIENFDYSVFTPFNSEIQGIINAIKTAKTSKNYTTKQKLAIIAAQIDRDIEWKKGNSPFVGFTSVSKKLNNANLVDGNDMFTTIYNYFKQRSMFSGEAIDKAKVVMDGIMQNYMAGYTVLMECLSAQLMVNALENKDGIDSYYLDHISTNTDEILAKIDELNKTVLGETIVRKEISKDESNIIRYEERRIGAFRYMAPVYGDKTVDVYELDSKNTVSAKYNNIINTSRRIFVNKGKANKEIRYIDVTNHGSLYSKNEDQAVGSFNSMVLSGNYLSGDQIKDLANYAKSKGQTVRELLSANGIDTSGLPKDTYLVTEKAYDDLGVRDFLSGIVGSVHLHGLYKGINVDEKNPGEKEVRMWNHGCNGYCSETWDFAEAGNAATIQVC